MAEIPYVSEDSLKKAEAMERKFLRLNKASGILFVSVRPIPTPDGEAEAFFITLGTKKDLSEGTTVALIKSLLAPELEDGIRVSIAAVRGICGPASEAANIH